MKVGFLIVGLYVITAYLGQILAVPAGYATAIWAPAGIALGGALVWGLRTLPAIFLGSFIINFYLSYVNTGHLLTVSLAGLIAAGAVLQALFGWWLIKKFLGLNNDLVYPKDILLFAFLSGPVSCLVNATWSVIALYLLNKLPAANMLLSWMTWWVGDSIGSLLITPLFLICFKKSTEVWRRIPLGRILPLSVSFITIIVIYSIVIKAEILRLELQFENKTKNIIDRLETQLNFSINSAYALTAHLSVIPAITKKSFTEYAQAVISREGSQQILAWVPEVIDKYQFTQDHHINIFGINHSHMIVDQQRSVYYPILYIEPYQENNSLIGLDLLSDTPRADALLAARSQRKLVVLAPIQLNQNNTKDVGTLFVSPVYNQNKFSGFSSVVLNLTHISDEILRNNQDYFLFTIKDALTKKEILNVNTNQSMAHDPKYVMSYHSILKVGPMNWEVSTISSMNYVNYAFSWQVWSLLPGGLLFCVLMNMILLILYGQKSLIQLKVNEQSAMLRAEEAKNLLVLNSAGEGILELDRNGAITFSNPAAQNLLGYNQQELTGKSINELSHGQVQLNNNNIESPILSSFKLDKFQHITDELFFRKDNTSFTVEYSITPIRKNNTVTGAVVVFNDITERRENQIRIEKMARLDMLTQLPNRFSFMNYLSQALDRAKRNKTLMAVFFIDIDNFKQINDNYGHQIGDKVLGLIPKLLSQRLRHIDFLGRLGGDEFGLILENINHESEVDVIAEEYIRLISKPLKILNQEINTSISVGIALFPKNGVTKEQLIKNADIAMYYAKEEGKNTFAYFGEEMNLLHRRRHEVDLALRQAIQNDEFHLVYQPQLDINTLQIMGVEVLLRMESSTQTVSSPKEFIPVAESNGLIHDIGRWVLEQVAKDYSALLEMIPGLKITINTSVKQLENPVFDDFIHELVIKHGMDPKHIYFEVTETALLKNPDRMLKMMHKLNDLGFRFALDDFGMGYSSMHYLKQLPISIIKIDQSFIQDMNHNSNDLAIVNATIKLAHGLNIITIAEGVETKDQFIHLKSSECDQIQGYYLAEPMRFNRLLQWINSDFRDKF